MSWSPSLGLHREPVWSARRWPRAIRLRKLLELVQGSAAEAVADTDLLLESCNHPEGRRSAAAGIPVVTVTATIIITPNTPQASPAGAMNIE